MPDQLRAALGRVQLRWRIRTICYALSGAGASFAAAWVVSASMPISLAAGAVMAMAIVAASSRMSLVGAAIAIEACEPLDNLIVTAAELDQHPRPVRAEVLSAIQGQAADRIARVDVAHVVPLMQPALMAAGIIAGAIAIGSVGPRSPVASQGAGSATTVRGAFTVRITPPAYTNRREEIFDSPTDVTAIAGSRLRIEGAGGRIIVDRVVSESAGIEVDAGDQSGKRFLALTVVPDAAPVVRVVTPGKDQAFTESRGRVAVSIESRDDLGLASLSLKLTKASGGGENVAFTETELPLRIERRDDRQWSALGEIDLASLALGDGDIVVYRAIARDSNPAASPVSSEQYVIEIGKNAGVSDAGFALPAEERKYAISQQMVIYKTEQLIARQRPGAAAASGGALDEARGIAIEQRMVRAEVVFLGGGEVEDELEEAARSDELTEGRLQNTGRVEMLRAINAMSRAEAQLNEGRIADALVFERQALASLERALDRRRFFLRTLPDRSRIDASRRLTGERQQARSWTREPAATAVGPSLEAHRSVIRALASSSPSEATTVAAQLTTLDPGSAELRQAAVALAAATATDAHRRAVDAAMQAVTAHAMRSVPASVAIPGASTMLSGLLVDQLSRGGKR